MLSRETHWGGLKGFEYVFNTKAVNITVLSTGCQFMEAEKISTEHLTLST